LSLIVIKTKIDRIYRYCFTR